MRSPSPLLLKVGALTEGNSYGFNYRAANYPGTGDLGSGRVVMPDWKNAADEWRKNGGEGESDWQEFARRAGILPDAIDLGWAYLQRTAKSINTTAPKERDLPSSSKPNQGPPIGKILSQPYQGSPVGDILARVRFGEALVALRTVLGEATSFWGNNVVSFHMMKTPFNPGPGLSFHTKSAEEVWRIAKQVADEMPKEQTSVIISRAMERMKVLMTELTPEDMKLLEMAVNWYLAGKSAGMEQPAPITNNNRLGGMPGGPFNSNSTGVGRGSP